MKLTVIQSENGTRIRCMECRCVFTKVTILQVGAIGGVMPGVEVPLCPHCLGVLRAVVRRRLRTLNPRVRLALELIQAEGVAYDTELRAKIGTYSTNTLKSLCTRGFATVEEVGPETLAYRITDRGKAALAIRDLGELP